MKTSMALLALSTTILFAEKKATLTHSFLGVGKANQVVIVGEDGKVQWRFGVPASDGWVLPSGNVLLALYGTKEFPNGGVAETRQLPTLTGLFKFTAYLGRFLDFS